VDRFSFVYTQSTDAVEYGRDRAECAYRTVPEKKDDDIEIVKREVAAWQKARNNKAQRLTGNSLPKTPD